MTTEHINATEMNHTAPLPANLEETDEKKLETTILKMKEFIQTLGEEAHHIDTFTRVIKSAFDYGSHWNPYTNDKKKEEVLENPNRNCFIPGGTCENHAVTSANFIQEFYETLLLGIEYLKDITYILAVIQEINDDLQKQVGLAHAISRVFFHFADSRHKLAGGFINFFTIAEKRYYYCPEFRPELLKKSEAERKVEILNMLKQVIERFAAQQLPKTKINNVVLNITNMLSTKQKSIVYTLLLCGEGQPLEKNLVDTEDNYYCCIYLEGKTIKLQVKLFDNSIFTSCVKLTPDKTLQLTTLLKDLKNHTTEIEQQISIAIKNSIKDISVSIHGNPACDIFTFTPEIERPASIPIPQNPLRQVIIFQ